MFALWLWVFPLFLSPSPWLFLCLGIPRWCSQIPSGELHSPGVFTICKKASGCFHIPDASTFPMLPHSRRCPPSTLDVLQAPWLCSPLVRVAFQPTISSGEDVSYVFLLFTYYFYLLLYLFPYFILPAPSPPHTHKQAVTCYHHSLNHYISPLWRSSFNMCSNV